MDAATVTALLPFVLTTLDLWGPAWTFPSAVVNSLGPSVALAGFLVTLFCVHVAFRCLLLARRRRALLLSGVRQGFIESHSGAAAPACADDLVPCQTKRWPEGFAQAAEAALDFTTPITTVQLTDFFLGRTAARVTAALAAVGRVAGLIATFGHSIDSGLAGAAAAGWLPSIARQVAAAEAAGAEASVTTVFDDPAARSFLAGAFATTALTLYVFVLPRLSVSHTQLLRYGLHLTALVGAVYAMATSTLPMRGPDPVHDQASALDLLAMKVFLVDNFSLSFEFSQGVSALWSPRTIEPPADEAGTDSPKLKKNDGSANFTASPSQRLVVTSGPRFHAWQRGRLDAALLWALVAHTAWIAFLTWCLPWHTGGTATTHFAARWAVSHPGERSVAVALAGFFILSFTLTRAGNAIVDCAHLWETVFGAVSPQSLARIGTPPTSVADRRAASVVAVTAFVIAQAAETPVRAVTRGVVNWTRVQFVPGLLLLYVVPPTLHHWSRAAIRRVECPRRMDEVPHLDFGPKRASVVGVVGLLATALAFLYL